MIDCQGNQMNYRPNEMRNNLIEDCLYWVLSKQMDYYMTQNQEIYGDQIRLQCLIFWQRTLPREGRASILVVSAAAVGSLMENQLAAELLIAAADAAAGAAVVGEQLVAADVARSD